MGDPQAVLEKVKQAGPEEALRLAADLLLEQLLPAMKAARTPKPEQAIEALRKTKLDLLLVRSLGIGRVSLRMVDDELARMRNALVTRELSANELKDGIKAFDSEAQRLSLAAGKNGRFHYHGEKNRARDSLITFGRSLHR